MKDREWKRSGKGNPHRSRVGCASGARDVPGTGMHGHDSRAVWKPGRFF